MAFISAARAGGQDVVRFLDLLGFSEGTSKASNSATAKITQNDGYDAIVEGVDGPAIFTDYSDHPFAHRPAVVVVEPGARFEDGLESTAAGRYQILLHFFEVYKVTLNLPDFSPLSQDLIAIQMMRERGSLAHLESGRIEAAIAAHVTSVDLEDAITEDASAWASLPGNTYGQGGRSMQQLLQEWSAL